MFDRDPLTALEAISAAQRLAFAPLAFQATVVMRDRGLLRTLADAPAGNGCTVEEVASAIALPVYAVRLLLEASLGLHIAWRRDGRYHLTKLGYILLNDEMTRVNLDFSRDVCWHPSAHLETSLREGRPAGLQELGPWPTLYEGLSILPEPARKSWHAFDHFYSDQAFPSVCDRLQANPPRRLLDVGSNDGKWAQLCLSRLEGVEVGLVDLPRQLERAQQRLCQAGLEARAKLCPLNILDPGSALPNGYDLIWMSQFLDCFSEDEILRILAKVREALPPDGQLWILELFWDRQRFEAAAFSLQQTSLYFACVANGNSQMYDSAIFLELLARAGLEIVELSDGIGGFHTLLQCRAIV